MFLNFLLDVNNYDTRKVGRVEPEDNCGVGVSTCYSSDEGFETALLNSETAYPVERYSSREEAEIGHAKWVKEARKMKHGTKIKVLGWSDFEGTSLDLTKHVSLTVKENP